MPRVVVPGPKKHETPDLWLVKRRLAKTTEFPVIWRRKGPELAEKKQSRQQVYTLLVQVGRKAGDGLPKGSTGAALMCYASGVDEAEAVRETVAILKQADLAPLDVTGYGTLAEREDQGHDIAQDERALMQRALDENSVIVAQMTPLTEKDQKRHADEDRLS